MLAEPVILSIRKQGRKYVELIARFVVLLADACQN
jgi:hypothetical protein